MIRISDFDDLVSAVVEELAKNSERFAYGVDTSDSESETVVKVYESDGDGVIKETKTMYVNGEKVKEYTKTYGGSKKKEEAAIGDKECKEKTDTVDEMPPFTGIKCKKKETSEEKPQDGACKCELNNVGIDWKLRYEILDKTTTSLEGDIADMKVYIDELEDKNNNQFSVIKSQEYDIKKMSSENSKLRSMVDSLRYNNEKLENENKALKNKIEQIKKIF